MVQVAKQLTRDVGFVEVADRVWVSRHSWFDVNVTAVGGERGLLVVDTLPSERAARAMVEDLRRAVGTEVVAVANTHEHFDHTFGNAVLRAAYPPVELYAHEEAAARTLAAGERIKALYDQPEEADDPHREEVQETRIVPAEETFSSVRVLDLGDRAVELLHPGRGHTAGDMVVRVADADVLLAGDLIEESADRDGVPGFGGDCYPMSWPATLDLVIGLLLPTTTVVPGHGNPVDRDFVEEQNDAISTVAETIRDLAGRGVPAQDGLAAAEWPFPRELLGDAVHRGYAELPPGARTLPLA